MAKSEEAADRPKSPLLVPLIVSAALFMETLDATVVTTALPDMARSFGRNPVDLSIGITVYVLALAIFIPVSGWVADKYGARHVFRGAIALFTLASIGCGFSTGLGSFVLARLVQGMAGALMVPVGRLIVLRNANKSELVRAIATLSTPALIGPVLGPPFGGFVTTYASWRWIFFFNVPIGILGIVLVTLFIGNTRETSRSPLDVVGFVLSGSSLALFMYALDQLRSTPLQGTAMIVASLAIGALALRHARRTPHSLIDLSLMRMPTFRATVTGGSLFRVALGSAPFLTPLMLQVGFGKSAFESGVLILASSIGNLSMKTATTVILRRAGFRPALMGSAMLTALSLLACCLFTARTSDAVILPVLFVSGLLRSLQFTCLNTIAFADVPIARMSAATSFSSMGQQVSLGIGVALGAILLEVTPLLRSLLAGQHLPPAGSLPDAVDFRLAFVVIALFALAPVLIYRSLPRTAGAELSGHVAR